MAHKKGAGSTDNGRDSASQRLGVKLFGGQHAIPGNILVRQRGTRYHPGKNVYMGKDHTLHAAVEGVVMFKRSVKDRTFVHIVPGTASTWAPEVAERLDVPQHEVKAPVKIIAVTAPSATQNAAPVEEKPAVAAAPVKSPAPAALKTEEPVHETPPATAAPIETSAPAALKMEEPVHEAPVAASVPVETPAPADLKMEEPDHQTHAVVATAVEPAASTPEVKTEAQEFPRFAEIPHFAELPVGEAETHSAPAASTETETPLPGRVDVRHESSANGDDLKIVEGIGPKIEMLLHEAGILTFSNLAGADIEKIKEILHQAGSRYSMHDPSTWPRQAKLAAEGKWEELEVLKKQLDGGREA